MRKLISPAYRCAGKKDKSAKADNRVQSQTSRAMCQRHEPTLLYPRFVIVFLKSSVVGSKCHGLRFERGAHECSYRATRRRMISKNSAATHRANRSKTTFCFCFWSFQKMKARDSDVAHDKPLKQATIASHSRQPLSDTVALNLYPRFDLFFEIMCSRVKVPWKAL